MQISLENKTQQKLTEVTRIYPSKPKIILLNIQQMRILSSEWTIQENVVSSFHNKVMPQDANVCETLNPLYLTDLPSLTSITLLISP
jgi:hypothetical protein